MTKAPWALPLGVIIGSLALLCSLAALLAQLRTVPSQPQMLARQEGEKEGSTDAEATTNHNFSLTLQPTEPSFRAGTIPSFRLTLTNITDHSCSLLNFEERPDLQHTYLKVVVTTDAGPVSVPLAISDPGPISDADWIQISAGGVKVLMLTNFAPCYELLPPGSYKAHVKFWPDPLRVMAYSSAEVHFEVIK